MSLSDPETASFQSVYVIDVRALLPLPEAEQRSVAASLNSSGEEANQAVSDAIAGQEWSVTTNVLQGVPAGQINAYA